MKRSLMRSRLALFVAAAVVFAPGWYARSEPPREAGLAERMLAPTGDEAAFTRGAAKIKPQLSGQYVKRIDPGASVAYVAAFMLGTLGLAFLWLIACDRVRSIFRFTCWTRLRRAPPFLQLA